MSEYRDAERIMWAHTMTRNNVFELVEEGMNIDDVLRWRKTSAEVEPKSVLSTTAKSAVLPELKSKHLIPIRGTGTFPQ